MPHVKRKPLQIERLAKCCEQVCRSLVGGERFSVNGVDYRKPLYVAFVRRICPNTANSQLRMPSTSV